ncbi:N-lysine methyltransferase SETD6, partial [Tremellales sp. Uapishka_1]
MSFEPESFLQYFQAAGGWVNTSIFGLKHYDDMGFGAIALTNIPENTHLFHIPLSLLLTPYTSELSSHLSAAEWEALEGGWTRLILVMMWETERGEASRWGGYLKSMPTTFDTPMFWSEEERRELTGTDIEGELYWDTRSSKRGAHGGVDRIGKEDAEKDYHERLVPVLRAHPELFPSGSANFSLDAFHLQGSRILSRSFTIPISKAGGPSESTAAEEDDSDDEDEEEEIAVMIPMADMLNAGYERATAQLYDDEEDDLEESAATRKRGDGYTMVSLRNTEAGEQIFNTYASPPNSELLRKYGHVDDLPLPENILKLLSPEEHDGWLRGNPGDEVEISGDIVLAVLSKTDDAQLKERVDWWLKEGQEDTFALSYDQPIDPALVSFVRLLILDFEWARSQKKGKIPNVVYDAQVVEVLQRVVQRRIQKYGEYTEIAEDLAHIRDPHSGLNRRNAAVVRLGEKRILGVAMRALAVEGKQVSETEGEGKRKGEGESEGKGKRRK